MQTQSATVVAIRAGKLTVSVENQVACARCAAGKGCGAGLLGGTSRPTLLELDAPEGGGFRAGDIVCLTMESEDLLRASWLAYGLPMISVVAVLAFLRLIAPDAGDAVAIAAASFVFAVSLYVARAWLQRAHCMRRLTPRISPAVTVGE